MDENHLSVLVALHTGNLSGIETYAEQIAAAAAEGPNHVTLVAVESEVSDGLSARLGAGVRVITCDPLPSAGWRLAARQVPTVALMELQALLGRRLQLLGERFDVAHLNHPALAATARPYADRVVVGGWFYPHRPRQRLVETWRHTGSRFPKSAGLAVKSLSHYWNDRRGYSASDCVVAPTQLLADQLRSLGIAAVTCPPPGGRVTAGGHTGAIRDGSGRRRIVMCCGDMSHPRKNIRAGIRAVRILAAAGMPIDLELIGSKTEALAEDVRALPASVRVVAPGRLSRERVADRLKSADVVVVPSLYEEWGYIATEAMLAGTPVVAFPVYPFVEILAGPLGRAAASMTPDSLAVAIKEVLESDVSRTSVAAYAARAFGSEAVGARLSEIWSGRGRSAGEPVTSLDAGWNRQ